MNAGERNWERGSEARGCEIVGQDVCTCTRERVGMLGRVGDRVRCVTHY